MFGSVISCSINRVSKQKPFHYYYRYYLIQSSDYLMDYCRHRSDDRSECGRNRWSDWLTGAETLSKKNKGVDIIGMTSGLMNCSTAVLMDYNSTRNSEGSVVGNYWTAYNLGLKC